MKSIITKLQFVLKSWDVEIICGQNTNRANHGLRCHRIFRRYHWCLDYKKHFIAIYDGHITLVTRKPPVIFTLRMYRTTNDGTCLPKIYAYHAGSVSTHLCYILQRHSHKALNLPICMNDTKHLAQITHERLNANKVVNPCQLTCSTCRFRQSVRGSDPTAKG